MIPFKLSSDHENSDDQRWDCEESYDHQNYPYNKSDQGHPSQFDDHDSYFTNDKSNISIDQGHRISHQSQQKSTKQIQNSKKPRNTTENISRNEPIVRQRRQRESRQQKKKCQTKNLPKFFLKLILKKAQSQNSKENTKYLGVKQKIDKYQKKSTSLKTLADVLKDPEINKIALEYIQSYEFLDDILTSERLQDVSCPIYYTNKIYEGCFNSNALDDWRQS